MICNSSGETEEAIEQINISLDGSPKVVVKSELTAAEKLIYEAYCSLFMVNITACIENYPNYLTCTRFGNASISDDTIIFDYSTIPIDQIEIVDNFISLVNSI